MIFEGILRVSVNVASRYSIIRKTAFLLTCNAFPVTLRLHGASSHGTLRAFHIQKILNNGLRILFLR